MIKEVKKEKLVEKIKVLDHNADMFIEYFAATDLLVEDFKFDEVKLKKCFNFVNLFFNYEIICYKKFAYLFIAHGRFISVYDIIKQRWKNHIKFESDQVYELFKIRKVVGFDIGV